MKIMLRQAFVILLLWVSTSAYSQYYYYDDKYFDSDILFEGGASLGIMNCVTDVGQKSGSPLWFSGYDWKSKKFCASAYFTVSYLSTWEGRAELTLGGIVGNDSRSNKIWQQRRNLSFKSKIFELSLTGAFHPFAAFDVSILPAWSPYVLAGVGVFSFYPKTYYNGEWVSLRRMNTEGQTTAEYPARKQYSLRAISFPVGFGLKYEVNARYNVRLEGVYRFTSSDYLDDVSTTYPSLSVYDNDMQKILSHRYKEINPRLDLTGKGRGNPAIKDQFFTVMIKVGYVFGREKIPPNIPK